MPSRFIWVSSISRRLGGGGKTGRLKGRLPAELPAPQKSFAGHGPAPRGAPAEAGVQAEARATPKGFAAMRRGAREFPKASLLLAERGPGVAVTLVVEKIFVG